MLGASVCVASSVVLSERWLKSTTRLMWRRIGLCLGDALMVIMLLSLISTTTNGPFQMEASFLFGMFWCTGKDARISSPT